jgi:hypothetical protein
MILTPISLEIELKIQESTILLHHVHRKKFGLEGSGFGKPSLMNRTLFFGQRHEHGAAPCIVVFSGQHLRN